MSEYIEKIMNEVTKKAQCDAFIMEKEKITKKWEAHSSKNIVDLRDILDCYQMIWKTSWGKKLVIYAKEEPFSSKEIIWIQSAIYLLQKIFNNEQED